MSSINPQDEIWMHVDGTTFAIAIGIAVIGAYLTASITEQLRLTFAMGSIYDVTSSYVWYLSLGIAMGSVCLWGMHIVGLSALRFEVAATGEFLPLTFDMNYVIGSLVLVTFGASVGLLIGSYDPMYMKTKVELLEEYLPGAEDMSLRQLRRVGTRKLLIVMLTNRWGLFVFGGSVNAAGFVLMHVMGMRSIQFQGKFIASPGSMIGWLFLIETLAIVGYSFFFRILCLFAEMEWLRIACGALLGLSSACVHIAGLMSYHVVYDSSVVVRESSMAISSAALTDRSTIALLLCMAGLTYVNMCDLRKLSIKLMAKKTEKMKANLTKQLQITKVLKEASWKSFKSWVGSMWKRKDTRIAAFRSKLRKVTRTPTNSLSSATRVVTEELVVKSRFEDPKGHAYTISTV
jgi:NO-binding membrane sensor protein with MHYT domain